MLDHQRINRYLANSGISSRRQADSIIYNGRVQINGEIAKVGDIVRDGDKVTLDGKLIAIISQKYYFALNKPRGYICSSKDEKGRRNCQSLINADVRIFTIGRLDKETEGLIILTNDGDFANLVQHPSKAISKVYQVEVRGESKNIIRIVKDFTRGMKIDGKMMIADRVVMKTIRENSAKFEVEIHQGYNRQLRRMSTFIGLQVLGLKRIRIGKLKLGNLKTGNYRTILPGEVL